MHELFRKLPGIMLILLGVSVMLGWILQIQSLVSLNSNFIPMAFNTAVCFVIVGTALLLCGSKSKNAHRLQVLLGLILALIGGLTLIQHILDINIGIDYFFVKNGFAYQTFQSDRMAPNTSINMFVTGLIFILLSFTSTKAVAVLIEILLFIVFLIGAIGLCGYIFNLEFLYGWFSYTRMSLLGVFGFIILVLDLWYEWRQNPDSVNWHKGQEDKKIILVSSIILLMIAFISGLAGFISAVKQQEDAIGKSFQQLLEGKIILVKNELTRVVSEFEAIRLNSLFQHAIKSKLYIRNSTELQSILQLFLAEGFSGVGLYDANGHLIAEKGSFVRQPSLKVNLNMAKHPSLFWKNGWYLEIKDYLDPQDKKAGFILVEWPLLGMDQMLDKNLNLGETADLLLCVAAENGKANCFPTRLNSTVFVMQRVLHGVKLPMDYALSGKTGTIIGYDYRFHQVLAAYSPMDTLGLGVVLKMDLSEIYGPIVKSLGSILPLIIAAIVVGILLLRLAVMPLIRRVIDTEDELINSNKQLQESQERYDLAVIGSQVGLWDWQVGTEHIFYSPLVKKMLGYQENEFTNSLAEFKARIHPDDRAEAEFAIEEHIKKHVPYNVEYRLRAKNGDYLWFQVMGQALWNAQGRAVRMAGSIMDITERKRNQQRQSSLYTVTQILSEAQSLEEAVPKILRAICEGMNWVYGGLWMADYQAKVLRNVAVWTKPTAHLTAFKEFVKNMVSQPGVGSLGRVWVTAKPTWVCDPVDEKKYPRIPVARAAGLHSSFSFPILLGYKVLGVIEFFSTDKEVPDQSTLNMMESIGPQVGQFILRKAAENELRESEAYKSAILESASDSIITMDDHGIIVSFNARTEKMFAYSEAAIKLKNINQLMPGLIAKIDDLVKNVSTEEIGIRSDGENFPIEMSLSEVVINNEHRYVAIIRDITERKKVEALKNEFISIVSHELRTPLTSIRGSIGLLLGGAVDAQFSGKAKKLLEIANSNCERLLKLINDILDIEKIEAGKMEFQLRMVDLNELVSETIIANQAYADKFSVKLQFTEKASNAKVYVDPDRLMQVITNLISNAVKFSPANEKVVIATQFQNQHIRLSVTDYGEGIAEEFKPRIFQKFSQSDSSTTRGKSGSGLGLSISKEIIEKLGGSINYISEPKIKTTFYFDLPCGDESKQPISQRIHKTEKRDKVEILICDDDQDQSNYLQALLHSAGFYVDTVENAAHAKKMLSEHKYDALLLDLILPDQDGIALIRELRTAEATRELPIIVISMICDTGRSLTNGDAVSVLDWLEKPVDFAKLLQAINIVKKKKDKKFPRILHVEDDKDICDVVAEILKDEAQVDFADSLQSARKKLQSDSFDLVILDLLLPDGNGAELLPMLSQKMLPIIVFSTAELDSQYSKYVNQVLLKSKSSNQELLDIIKNLLKNKESLHGK